MPQKTEVAAKKSADHLVVLVHGLWGSPDHLANLVKGLKEKFRDEDIRILVATSNRHYHTYDGIEVGGERVASEIEEELKRLRDDGENITKFSMIGYSLGGLIARYCIGLLYSRGCFDTAKPINFTTFASPHLGVRAPVKGYGASFWNALGGRTLSTSGRQMFLIDNFRGEGRPLLSIMADPDSVFVKALLQFRNRSLYANIVNDRSVPFYTAAFTKTDPFTDIDRVELNDMKAYAPVLLDPENPCRPAERSEPSTYERAKASTSAFFNSVPLFILLGVLFPIGSVAFLVNSGIQTVRSGRRIKLHESTPDFQSYRIPLMLESARHTIGHTLQRINSNQAKIYVDSDGEKTTHPARKSSKRSFSFSSKKSSWPTLALSDEQFEMIENLNEIGWRKYPVHITLSSHSHAAIIARRKRENQKEGFTVIKHWLHEDFVL